MRKFDIEDKLKKILLKLSKKDKHKYGIIMKKINEIVSCKDIEYYKNLRSPLQHLKSVHIDSHFVLAFRYDKTNDIVIFYDFDHHDNIFGK